MRDGITVLIPVYNGARYLSECIQSVVDQTLPAAEIIIVDDGSQDNTPEVAQAWSARVRYHRVPHGGLPYARNHGLRFTETELIAFIDSDDIWLPRKLELQMTALSREARPTMVFGYTQEFISGDLTSAEAAGLKCKTEPLPGMFGSTLLMRKSDCESAGPFDESIELGEFIEWYTRAQDAGIKPIVIPETVCRRRLHRNNLSRGGAALHGQYTQMLKKVLDRRREQK
jgi:glycosyltransferase involved in cell wall biosynthesis